MPFLRRPSSLLRLLLLLAILIGSVVRPALALAGALHRDMHDLAHAAALHAPGDLAAVPADDAEEHAPAQGWHALLHLDLCCGTAALTGVAPALIPPAALCAVLPYRPRAFAPAPDSDPLRPPIRA
ncbi:hypothetical protein [Tahibacter caeni]|uniref:hypothetical protein n=1 Tax=Tahibacter caeni TaxID=1453545 RepID=UPI0021480960|nr:hypothetical protein [Tahibacter caeni]